MQKTTSYRRANNIVRICFVAATALLASCEDEPKQQILESKAAVREAEEDLAGDVLVGEGTVCGKPELAEMVRRYIRNEDALRAKYPDIAPAKIQKVLDDANIQIPPATIESVNSDVGVVVCRFGSMVMAAQATADGAHLKIRPGNGTTSTYMVMFRIAVDRELQKLRGGAASGQRAEGSFANASPADNTSDERSAMDISVQRDVAADCANAERRAKAVMNALRLAEGSEDSHKIEASREAAISELKAACAE